METTDTRPDAGEWHRFDAGRLGQFWVPTHELVETSCGPMSVRDGGGDGPVVVLAHGWAADSVLNWFRVFAPLASAGWRVIAVDAPGHGRSPSVGRFTLDGAGAALAAVLAELDVYDATLVGYSMGGPITQIATANDPARVAYLVQVATAARLVPPGVRSRVLAGAARVAGVGAGALDTLGRLGGRTQSAGSLAGHALDVGRHGSKRTLFQAGWELTAYDSSDWVAGIRVPATCVVTESDTVVLPDAQRDLARLLDARVVSVGHGHTLCLDTEFAGIVIGSMTQLRVSLGTKTADLNERVSDRSK
jgi:pimeloyl-ACP methyl ester carboxylesterase